MDTAAILRRMEEGESLRKACKANGTTHTSFLRLCDADSELANQYARAREAMLDAQAEALEDIGDQAANAENAVEVAGLRLKSDNRKWLLSKLAPKKYGDKSVLEHQGGFKVTTATELNDDELAAIASSGGK